MHTQQTFQWLKGYIIIPVPLMQVVLILNSYEQLSSCPVVVLLYPFCEFVFCNLLFFVCVCVCVCVCSCNLLCFDGVYINKWTAYDVIKSVATSKILL